MYIKNQLSPVLQTMQIEYGDASHFLIMPKHEQFINYITYIIQMPHKFNRI